MNKFWLPGSDFGFSIDNFGSTFTNAGFAAAVTSGAANTKGSGTSLIAGASVTEDIYGIAICFSNGFTNAAARTWLVDILIDPAGGTSWSTIIPNLLATGPALSLGGYWYYFPLFLKAGTSVGCQVQCNAATQTMRVGVKLVGKPSRPDRLKVGSRVEAFGVDLANTLGTPITLGTSTKGSYTASMGVTASDLWWWQCGYAPNDATQTGDAQLLDVAVNATNKILVLENLFSQTNSGEAGGKVAFGDQLPIKHVAAGQDVYMRGSTVLAAPDSGTTVMAYGLGG